MVGLRVADKQLGGRFLMVVGPLRSQHIQAWYAKYAKAEVGLDLVVVTLHAGGRELPAGVLVHDLAVTGTRFDYLLAMPLFLWFWWRYRPVVTNFHFLSSYGLWSLLLPRRAKLLLSVWGSDVNLLVQRKGIKIGLQRWLVGLALPRFCWINAPAEHLRQKLGVLGANLSAVEVFQYGVDVGKLLAIAQATADAAAVADAGTDAGADAGAGAGAGASAGAVAAAKTKADKRELRVISNRNWQPLYQIEAVVAGFLQWQSQASAPRAKLYLYGGGDAADSAAVLGVLKAAPESISSRVEVVGYAPHESMLATMAGADLFISIPQRDGTPLSLLEALLLELYPVVADIDANREWLSANSAQFVADYSATGVAQALAEAANNCLQQEAYRHLNCNKVLQLADSRCNLPRFYALLAKFAVQEGE